MKKSSTKPKGATSYKQTAFGIIPRQQLLRLELEGIKKGLEFIADSHLQTLSPQIILQIHAISFAWIFPDWGVKSEGKRVKAGSGQC